MRNNEQGFSWVEVLLIVVIVGMIGAVGFYVFKQRNIANQAEQSGNQTNSTTTTEAKTAPAPADPTANWKTYTSPLSGYTIKYPADWVVANSGDIFTNNNGGKSTSLSLQNVQRTGSRSGHDANTYVCVIIDDYTKTGWTRSPENTAGLPVVSTFKPNSGTQLSIVARDGQQPMLGSLVVSNGNNNYISVDAQYELNAWASFNCMQGDYNAINNSSDNYRNRPEMGTARQVLETLRY